MKTRINWGQKNGAWKGEEVGYAALHDYVKYHFPKPEKCQNCKEEKPLDLANISGEYKRDLSDWEWLCRKCHMIKDGRIEKLIQRQGNPKLSKDKVISIRKEYSVGIITYRQLANKYNVHLATIAKIVTYQRWRNI